MGQIQNASRNRGTTDFFTSTIRTVVQPAATPARFITDGTGDFFTGLFSGKNYPEENRLLAAQLSALEIYSDQIADLEREVESLRIMQSFGPLPGKERVTALVIGNAPYENLATLNVGKEQGIRVGNPVIASKGLLGTVISVEANRCQVSLLSATNSRLKIGAIDITRKPPAAGLLHRLSVVFHDPLAPVEVGDKIVTSGFSEQIPRHLIIGKVIFVEYSQTEGTKKAWIDPAVSIGEVRTVQVLK